METTPVNTMRSDSDNESKEDQIVPKELNDLVMMKSQGNESVISKAHDDLPTCDDVVIGKKNKESSENLENEESVEDIPDELKTLLGNIGNLKLNSTIQREKPESSERLKLEKNTGNVKSPLKTEGKNIAPTNVTVKDLMPLRFHNVHGEYIKMSDDYCTAERVIPKSGKTFLHGPVIPLITPSHKSFAFSSRPIANNETVFLRLDIFLGLYLYPFGFGFTDCDPNIVAEVMPRLCESGSCIFRDQLNILPDNINDKDKRQFMIEYLPKHLYNEYKRGEKYSFTFYFFVNPSGKVWYGLNDVCLGCLPGVLNINTPLWALIQLTNDVSTVKFMESPKENYTEDIKALNVEKPSSSSRNPFTENPDNREHQNTEVLLKSTTPSRRQSAEKPDSLTLVKDASQNNLSDLRFHSVHGKCVKISVDRSNAKCQKASVKSLVLGNFVFSSRPIDIDEKVYLKLETVSKTNKVISFGIGFTNCDPGIIPDVMNRVCKSNHCIFGDKMYYVQDMFLIKDHYLHFYVNQSGEIHFGVNDEEKGVCLRGIETRSPVWAVIRLSDNVSSVTLERKKPDSFKPSFEREVPSLLKNPTSTSPIENFKYEIQEGTSKHAPEDENKSKIKAVPHDDSDKDDDAAEARKPKESPGIETDELTKRLGNIGNLQLKSKIERENSTSAERFKPETNTENVKSALKTEEVTPVKGPPEMSSGEVIEALQRQIKMLNWTLDRERLDRISACRKAERLALHALRPLENPGTPAAKARRQAAAALEKDLARLQSDWTLFVARSGLVKFPSELGQYAHALQLHKEKQREIRRQLESRLAALQTEVKEQLLVHRPWRCVEADFAKFPTPELTAVLSSKSMDIGTITYPAHAQAQPDETIFVIPSQLSRLRELVNELHSDEIKLELRSLDNNTALYNDDPVHGTKEEENKLTQEEKTDAVKKTVPENKRRVNTAVGGDLGKDGHTTDDEKLMKITESRPSTSRIENFKYEIQEGTSKHAPEDENKSKIKAVPHDDLDKDDDVAEARKPKESHGIETDELTKRLGNIGNLQLNSTIERENPASTERLKPETNTENVKSALKTEGSGTSPTNVAANDLTPLRFHGVHGQFIKISNDYCTAQSAIPKDIPFLLAHDGFAFSSRPVAINEKVYLRLETVSNTFIHPFGFGFTDYDPNTIATLMPRLCRFRTCVFCKWLNYLPKCFSNKSVTFYFFVKPSGKVCYGINGKDMGCLSKLINISTPLWAIIKLSRNVSIVKFIESSKENETEDLKSMNVEKASTSKENIGKSQHQNTEVILESPAPASGLSAEKPGLLSSNTPAKQIQPTSTVIEENQEMYNDDVLYFAKIVEYHMCRIPERKKFKCMRKILEVIDNL